MKPNVIKIGICGLGERIGRVVKFLASADQRFKFVSYVDERPLGLEYLEKHNISVGYKHGNLAEMLALEKLDVLMVGSPNDMHFEHIEAGLQAGLTVFTEKPVVTTEAETFRLLELINQYGSDRILVGLVLRYSPLYQKLLALRNLGNIGSISSIEASEHLGPAHGAFFMKDWRRHENRSGGYLLEKCCHDLDLYQHIVGSLPQRVSSFGGRKTFIPKNETLAHEEVYQSWQGGWGSSDASAFNSDADIVDHQSVLIEYIDGVVMNFHTNLHVPHKSRHFAIFGINGMAEGDFERNYLQLHSAKTGEKTFELHFEHKDDDDGHYGAEENMARDFSNHFFEGKPLPVSVLDALIAGLTAIKADESRRTGKTIDLVDTWAKFFGTLSDIDQARYKHYFGT
jgi:predicted dehydrogenase